MIRKLVSDVMHRSAKSRAQIADEMSQLTRVEITANMLNGYAAPSKTGIRFPAAFIDAFCQVTGDDGLQRLLLSPELRKKIEIVERELTAAREKREAGRLREQLLSAQNSLPLFADTAHGNDFPQLVPATVIRSKGGVR